MSATVSLGAGANGFPVATLSEAQRLLACATTIGEIQKVESLAQLAVEFAKRARLGRAAINAAARIALDARRKAGSSLKTMIERGELAGPGKPKISHRAILHTLGDLGITPSQSSLYQKEACVPPDVYEAWVRRVIESKDRVLSAKGLRALGRQYGKSGGRDDPPLSFAAAASRIRRLLAKLRKQMDGDGRARLAGLLKSLSGQCETDALVDREKLGQLRPQKENYDVETLVELEGPNSGTQSLP